LPFGLPTLGFSHRVELVVAVLLVLVLLFIKLSLLSFGFVLSEIRIVIRP
jgi:hypothetical protein